jgi:sulfotransferase family protein
MREIEPPIFIVGLHRTGSTVWHNVLAMAPGICRITDMRFIGSWWQRDFRYFLRHQVGDLSRDENVDRLVELMFSRRSVPGLESAFWRFENFDFVDKPEFREAVARQIKASDRSIGTVFRALLDQLCIAAGANRCCVKFPVEEGHLGVLLQWYPGCRIVHITRDPRAMAISRTNDPGGTAVKVSKHPRLGELIRKVMVLLVVLQYAKTARCYRRYRTLPNYRLFRFEDLLAHPRRVLQDLCQFTGLTFVEGMLEPEKGKHEHQASSITGEQHKEFDPRAATRWRSVISPLAYTVVTFLTKRSMRRLDYDPATHAVFTATAGR